MGVVGDEVVIWFVLVVMGIEIRIGCFWISYNGGVIIECFYQCGDYCFWVDWLVLRCGKWIEFGKFGLLGCLSLCCVVLLSYVWQCCNFCYKCFQCQLGIGIDGDFGLVIGVDYYWIVVDVQDYFVLFWRVLVFGGY